jgi:nucleotide-binding universal stress UspA family protein
MDALLEEFKAEGIEAQGELEFAETPKTSEHIIEKAKKANADLIAVGSHGRKGLSKMLLGSVAEKVARNAPCSVLITRHMS